MPSGANTIGIKKSIFGETETLSREMARVIELRGDVNCMSLGRVLGFEDNFEVIYEGVLEGCRVKLSLLRCYNKVNEPSVRREKPLSYVFITTNQPFHRCK